MAAIRLGLIGFGFIGRAMYERATADPAFEIAFVWNRTPSRIDGPPRSVILAELGDFASRGPDLVIEMAHPAVSAKHGEAILGECDYLPLSVTALADDRLRDALLKACTDNGTALFIPHGALIGVDNLFEARENWEDVEITFRKHPASLDLSAIDIDPADLAGPRTLFAGSVRDAAALFPRNVNTMATCALATLGFDRTRARVIADSGLDAMVAEVRARGKDGSRMETMREERAVGVSGTGMLASQWASIRRAARGGEPGLNFV